MGRIAILPWLPLGVIGNSYYADQSLLYRVIALLVLAIAAGWVASTTVRGGAFWQLVKGARTEIRKVIWPTRQETTQTTMIVVVFVFVMALILWAMDSLLGWLVSMANRLEERSDMTMRWYVVHAFSQYEKKVAVALKERIDRNEMQDRFGDIIVPTEEVVEMKAGQKRKSERKFFPGLRAGANGAR